MRARKIVGSVAMSYGVVVVEKAPGRIKLHKRLRTWEKAKKKGVLGFGCWIEMERWEWRALCANERFPRVFSNAKKYSSYCKPEKRFASKISLFCFFEVLHCKLHVHVCNKIYFLTVLLVLQYSCICISRVSFSFDCRRRLKKFSIFIIISLLQTTQKDSSCFHSFSLQCEHTRRPHHSISSPTRGVLDFQQTNASIF